MTDSLSLEQRQAQAAQTVRRFVRRFQPGYRALACHAALPLVLTPELVNYLRNEFLRDQGVPWVAEVDLLLSDLCQPVGYELYALDTDVRAYLLAELERQYGQGRLRQVAKLLISYVRYLAESNPQANAKELEAQQWAAMVYLGAGQRQEAVRQIVAQLQGGAATVERLGAGLVGQAELARLAEIATEFAPQLVDYPALVDYAALVREVMAGESVIAPDRLAQAYEVLPGQSLRLPEPLARQARVGVEMSGGAVLPEVQASGTLEVWPELKTLKFQTGRWVEESATDEAAPDWPPLQTETVEVVTLAFEDAAAQKTATPETAGAIPEVELVPFTFEVATLNRQGGGWQVQKRQQQAQRYIERLGNSVFLTLVAIPGGSFVMGSPEDEQGRYDREGPQHHVQVPAFFMGRYPVTQEQWRAVVAMPMQSRELNPDPSRFKGDNRPVERVSWYDAVEFCDRLSAHTGRQYRLPSEAEWEYACRAGTNTPFHFGDTLSPEVANYRSRSAYANGPTGSRPGRTTSVDRYGVANGFGLCDMHGNIWEWCLDHYHNSYEGAPTNGSAWVDAEAEENKKRIRRGGSWHFNPMNCRSAHRSFSLSPHKSTNDSVGFRVMCVVPRALG